MTNCEVAPGTCIECARLATFKTGPDIGANFGYQLLVDWNQGRVDRSDAPEYGRENSAWFMAKEWLRSHNKTDIHAYLKLNYKVNKDLDLSIRTQVTTWDQLRTEKVPPSAKPITALIATSEPPAICAQTLCIPGKAGVSPSPKP